MIKEIFVNKCETKPRTFLCKCECGSKKIVKIRYLIRGKYPSCGCYAREATRISNKKRSDRSGLHHPLFTTWTMIVARCNYKKQTVYKYYGGRGIKVCDKWNPRITDKGKAFCNFAKWAENNGWFKDCGLTLDRVDNNGHYTPRNCRWATKEVQSSNVRNNVKLTYKGKEMTIIEAHKKYAVEGISLNLLRERIHKGWSAKKSLTFPKHKNQFG